MKLRKIYRNIFILIILSLFALPILAQDKTIGLLVNSDDAYEGYTLFAPQVNEFVYLMDNMGRIVHTWTTEKGPTREAHLLENGNLIVITPPTEKIDTSLIPAAFPPDGSIREYTWDGEEVWKYEFVSAEIHQHHGLDIMPNGNLLLISWKYYTLEEALANGLDPEIAEAEFAEHPYILPDIIQEIDRSTNEVVWEWDPWDHLIQDRNPDLPNYGVIAENPHRIDINYQSYYLKGSPSTSNAGAGDWMHSNAVNYNPELDQVLLSVRSFDEYWVIDHNTTTEEAAGPSGDLLYRWGNPFAYGQGDQVEDRQLFGQHDVQWIKNGLNGAGHILIFNNLVGEGTDEVHSSAVELKTPIQTDGSYDLSVDSEIVWSYDDILGRFLSGVQRLPNGNTLITEGPIGRFTEVTPEGEVVWQYVNPTTTDGSLLVQGEEVATNATFRVRKYGLDFAGFEGRDLTPGEPLID